MELILCRHGEGEQNVGGWYNSDPAHPDYREAHLTQTGIDQAVRLGRALRQEGVTNDNVLAVCASPLPRAQQTAHLVLAKLAIDPERLQIHSGLKEAQAGDRESRLLAQYEEADHWFPKQPESFNAESSEMIRQRMLAASYSIYEQCRENGKNNDGCILIFSHGSPIYWLLEALMGAGEKLPTAGFRKLPFPPASH